MISARQVDDAILVLLRGATDLPVGDRTAPPGDPTLYAVLEPRSGSPTDGGTFADPEAHLVRHLRIRAVQLQSDPSLGRKAAQDLAHVLAVAILDRSVPIAGDGWTISDRTLSGTDELTDGRATNVFYDIDLAAVPA